MTLCLDTLEMQFEGSCCGLSARRLWDHTESGQINVFQQPIRQGSSQNDPAIFIDLAWMQDTGVTLLGCTLYEWRLGRHVIHPESEGIPLDRSLLNSPEVIVFISSVAKHIETVAQRQATRNQHVEFLPPASANDAFGLPMLSSTLQRLLRDIGKTTVDAKQWEGTILNFQKKGLRIDELNQSGLLPYLDALRSSGSKSTAQGLLQACDFSALRLSVIPVIRYAEKQLDFVPATERRWKRALKASKPQVGQDRRVAEFDPVLGYRIEEIEHQTLWGIDRHWQAVSYDGRTLDDPDHKSLFPTPYYAALASRKDAKRRFPKRMALGRWNELAWTGGKDYREWLVTLPYYPASYVSSHFDVRNVLAHIRCDVRDGPDGERVLLVHEVQSDWAKSVRDAIDTGEADSDCEQFPPFWREWSALTMKLVLLHALHQGVDAVAWTKGAHQVHRYEGFGASGLKQLYDQILPREVNRLLQPFGLSCGELGVFVPENFSIKRTESGYEVHSTGRRVFTLLGTAQTLEEARQFVPDGGHELLYDVHGVWLSKASRQAILSAGFSAWG